MYHGISQRPLLTRIWCPSHEAKCFLTFGTKTNWLFNQSKPWPWWSMVVAAVCYGPSFMHPSTFSTVCPTQSHTQLLPGRFRALGRWYPGWGANPHAGHNSMPIDIIQPSAFTQNSEISVSYWSWRWWKRSPSEQPKAQMYANKRMASEVEDKHFWMKIPKCKSSGKPQDWFVQRRSLCNLIDLGVFFSFCLHQMNLIFNMDIFI